jgi:hypothetical protein
MKVLPAASVATGRPGECALQGCQNKSAKLLCFLQVSKISLVQESSPCYKVYYPPRLVKHLSIAVSRVENTSHSPERLLRGSISTDWSLLRTICALPNRKICNLQKSRLALRQHFSSASHSRIQARVRASTGLNLLVAKIYDPAFIFNM